MVLTYTFDVLFFNWSLADEWHFQTSSNSKLPLKEQLVKNNYERETAKAVVNGKPLNFNSCWFWTINKLFNNVINF